MAPEVEAAAAAADSVLGFLQAKELLDGACELDTAETERVRVCAKDFSHVQRPHTGPVILC